MTNAILEVVASWLMVENWQKTRGKLKVSYSDPVTRGQTQTLICFWPTEQVEWRSAIIQSIFFINGITGTFLVIQMFELDYFELSIYAEGTTFALLISSYEWSEKYCWFARFVQIVILFQSKYESKWISLNLGEIRWKSFCTVRFATRE